MVDLGMKEPHQKEYQIEAVISVDFGPKILLKERLTSALRGSGIALPFWSIGHSADFTTLCPHPTAEQEAAWAARRFWQFATGESACKTYKLTICTASLLSATSLVDRSPPKLVAFVTCRDFDEHKIWMIKNASVVTCAVEASGPSEHCCAFEFASPTSLIEIDPKLFLNALPDMSLYGQIPVPVLPKGNFKPIFKIQSTIWTNPLTISTLPLWMATDIASWLPLPFVQSLTQAVPTLRDALDAEPARRITELLAPYFVDLKPFIKLLIKTGSIVTASISLKAFQGCGEPWSPGDLDLVVPAESVPEFTRFMTCHGWTMDSATMRRRAYTSYGDTGAPGPFQAGFQVFKKGTRTIDICSPMHMHPVDYVLTYHSTPPMAIFTGTSVGHLFPDLTLAHKLQRSTYGRTHRHSSDGDEGRNKYIARGYEPVPDSKGLAVPVDADSRNTLKAVKGRIWRAKVVM